MIRRHQVRRAVDFVTSGSTGAPPDSILKQTGWFFWWAFVASTICFGVGIVVTGLVGFLWGVFPRPMFWGLIAAFVVVSSALWLYRRYD